MSFPFGFSTEGTPFDGAVYTVSGTNVGAGTLDINFTGVSEIEANKPYLLYLEGEKVVNPRFTDVDINHFNEDYFDIDNVRFHSTMYYHSATKEKKYVFIINNRLYFPNQSSGTKIRAFRGYFEITDYDATPYWVEPRVRIVVGDQNATAIDVIEMDNQPAQDTNTDVRKYIENGVLIIERGGIRYDAQGCRID